VRSLEGNAPYESAIGEKITSAHASPFPIALALGGIYPDSLVGSNLGYSRRIESPPSPIMFKYDSQMLLPSAEDLPDSDDTPVDNELQDLIPGLLKAVLAMAWSDRMDWFFGVDMGIYYDPKQPAIVPDGFLSLGVERIIDTDLRLSYVLWEEKTVPILVLEVVSQTQRGEHTTKKEKYAEMGVMYYAVYCPCRRRKPPL